jgi:hypothetical protein
MRKFLARATGVAALLAGLGSAGAQEEQAVLVRDGRPASCLVLAQEMGRPLFVEKRPAYFQDVNPAARLSWTASRPAWPLLVCLRQGSWPGAGFPNRRLVPSRWERGTLNRVRIAAEPT